MSKSTAEVVQHPLRLLLLASFLISLPTNIAAAATLHGPFPIFGLVPLGVSALFAICFMSMPRYAVTAGARSLSSTATIAAIAFVNDILALLALAAILFLSWTYAYEHWYWDRSLLFMVAYATAPMFFNLVAHTILVALMLFRAVGIHRRIIQVIYPSCPLDLCPHCHQGLPSVHQSDYPSPQGPSYEPVDVKEGVRFHDSEEGKVLLDSERKLHRVIEASKGKGKSL